MSATARCSACGAELSQDAAPQGLCAACLLKLGLSSTNIPPAEEPSLAAGLQAPERKRSSRRIGTILKIGLIMALLVLIALAFVQVSRRPEVRSQSVFRFSLFLPNSIDFAVSQDGRRLAFTAMNEERKTLIWIRPLDSFNETPLRETEGAAAPFWSPDSRWIGFFARGKLKKVDIASGANEVLSDAPTGKSGAWGPNGFIVFARSATGGLFRVSDRGGTAEPITKIDQSDRQGTAHRWPHFLPDGHHFIYTTTTLNGETDGIFVTSMDSHETKRITTGRSGAAYAEGSLLFVGSGTLLVQPFDFRSLEISGDARPLRFAEEIDRFSTSMNGVLAYRRSEQRPASPMGWFDRSGKHLDALDGLDGARQFSISPDGRSVAASRSGDIWVADLSRGVNSRFTFNPTEDTFRLWSPDGSRIAFLSTRGGQTSVYQKAANAASSEELLLEGRPRVESLESWSPDGKFLLYTIRDDKDKSTVWVLPMSGANASPVGRSNQEMTGDRKPFVIQSAFNIREPRFSPDARWVTYVSDESGRDEIYIESFPPGGSKWQVSTDGGTNPKWRRDGRELFYISQNSSMLMGVAIEANAPALRLSVPRPQFETRGLGPYDVSGDGQRFLVSLQSEEMPSAPIDVVINWASEMQR